MADLFISYAREDKARADQVANALAAQGLDVFWDSEIPPGQTWADYIEEKLSNCAAVVVLWSENSTKSHWVREEARMGRERGKLIPAVLDASPPPFGFAEVQSADLSTWAGQPNHPDWERFVGAVKAAVSRGPAPAAPRPAPRTPQSPPIQPAWSATAGGAEPLAQKPKRNWLLWGGVGAGVVALLVVFTIVSEQQSQNAGMAQTVDATAVQTAPPQGGNPMPQGVMTAPAGTPTAPGAPMPQIEPQYRQQLDVQLAQVAQALGSQGFMPVGQPYYGGLRDDQQERIPPTELQQGGDYRIVGVCDADCSDLDLVLVDQNQVEIARDTSTDARPIVQSQPAWTGPFHVDVTMYQCNHPNGCYYALMLYGRAAN